MWLTMWVRKEVRCPKCNAIPEETGYHTASMPPFIAIKCSSNLCDFRGYLHGMDICDEGFKKINGNITNDNTI